MGMRRCESVKCEIASHLKNKKNKLKIKLLFSQSVKFSQ